MDAQELIDAKGKYQKMLNVEKLHFLFSESILGYMLETYALTEFDELIASAGNLLLSQRGLKSLKGLNFMRSLNELQLDTNGLTDIGDISGLTKLTELKLNTNQLTDVGSVSGLIKLTTLYVNVNQFTDIGVVSALVDLVYFYASSNQLSNIGSVSGLTSLYRLRLDNNQFPTAAVDAILSDMKAAHQATGSITQVYLANNSVPTGGATNADYLYLTDAGVTVTIDV